MCAHFGGVDPLHDESVRPIYIYVYIYIYIYIYIYMYIYII